MAKIVRKNDEYLPRGYIYNYEELIDVAHNFNETTGAFSVKKEDDAGIYIFFIRGFRNGGQISMVDQEYDVIAKFPDYDDKGLEFKEVVTVNLSNGSSISLFCDNSDSIKVGQLQDNYSFDFWGWKI